MFYGTQSAEKRWALESMNLVHLRLRRGEAIADARPAEGTGTLYFCAKDWCPHYQGQLGLLAGADAMHCALVQHPPDRICQPFYLEVAETLDRHRRQTWEQRLAEAEAFETTVAAAAGGAP
jgi:hypothetical protein